MSMFETPAFGACAAIAIALALHGGAAAAADAPHFGQPISPADAAAGDISVGPDGAGLPPGSGTPAQGAVSMRRSAPRVMATKARAKLTPAWSAVRSPATGRS